MKLTEDKVLQTIKNDSRKLGIEDIVFDVRYAEKHDKMGKRAEIFVRSKNRAGIVLYPDATLFSVHHELCHAKLFRMGFPLTNTKKDFELFPNSDDYMRMVVIVEWYVNELQKRVFNEYYAIDEAGTPRPPPFPEMPELPNDEFTFEQIRYIIEIAKGKSKEDTF